MPKVVEMLRDAAPFISGALTATGPLGTAAGIVLNTALGLDIAASAKQQEKALEAATPEQWLAIKQAEQDFILKMRGFDVDEEKVHQTDRADARNMYTETKDDTSRLLSFIIIPAVLAYIVCITFVQMPPNGEQIAMQVLSYLFGVVTTILSFWFGSSNGSKQKNDVITTIAKGR